MSDVSVQYVEPDVKVIIQYFVPAEEPATEA